MQKERWFRENYRDLLKYSIWGAFFGFVEACTFYYFLPIFLKLNVFLILPPLNIYIIYRNYKYLIVNDLLETKNQKYVYITIPQIVCLLAIIAMQWIPIKHFDWTWFLSVVLNFINDVFYK